MVEHRLHDFRHARHDENVFDVETGRRRNGVVDKLRALGRFRHAQAGLVQLHPARGVIVFQYLFRFFVHAEGQVECFRDAFGGDVVVRGADAARGEDIGIGRAQGVQPLHDAGLDIGHDAHFRQADAALDKAFRDKGDVRILRRAGQNFVAYQKDGCCGGLVCHGGSAMAAHAIYLPRNPRANFLFPLFSGVFGVILSLWR